MVHLNFKNVQKDSFSDKAKSSKYLNARKLWDMCYTILFLYNMSYVLVFIVALLNFVDKLVFDDLF